MIGQIYLELAAIYEPNIPDVKQPMSSKSPQFGRLTAILKKIDDYIAMNK